MAKRKVAHKGQGRFSSNGNGRSEKNTNQMEYTSALGTKVIFLPMPPMLMEKIESALEREWPCPEPPTYRMKTAAGPVEERPHNETTLETDEDRAAWAAYTQELGEWEDENNRRVLRAIQLQCIKPVDPDDTEWIERQQFLGMDVPENKFERHLHWIETEFIGDEDDVMACMTIPMRLVSKASEEEIEAAERLFRDAIQEEKASRRTAQAKE